MCIVLDYKNLKFENLIDDIGIDFLSFRNFASMNDIKRKCNLLVDLSKFTFNNNNKKKVLSEVITITYKLVCS